MKFFGTFFCDRLYVYDSVLYTEFCFEYDSVMFILKNCKSYFFSKKSFLQKKAYSVMFLEKSIDLFGLICVAIFPKLPSNWTNYQICSSPTKLTAGKARNVSSEQIRLLLERTARFAVPDSVPAEAISQIL